MQSRIGAEAASPALQGSSSSDAVPSTRPPTPARLPSPSLSTSVEVGPGKTVEIIRKLGKGATATVWEGILSGRSIAVKQISLFVRLLAKCDNDQF